MPPPRPPSLVVSNVPNPPDRPAGKSLQARAVLIQEDRTIVGVIIEKASGLSIDKRVSGRCGRSVLGSPGRDGQGRRWRRRRLRLPRGQ
jgi:hypothetical protein